MARRQREWAQRATLALEMKLGGKCSVCGKTTNLQFDCIQPAGHWHHRIEWSWRISFYRQQHERNNLQLLCIECHSHKTNGEQP